MIDLPASLYLSIPLAFLDQSPGNEYPKRLLVCSIVKIHYIQEWISTNLVNQEAFLESLTGWWLLECQKMPCLITVSENS